ncbi:hypothetical protein Taro_052006 [Colocasia esculenta]|uniref:Uncharacterized protein n=1 Tax=Colocasia esculenta TaxID=4460 RepID=A0A843XHF8_COLES|nr:hypothetical protein [Colocasia esculenta]
MMKIEDGIPSSKPFSSKLLRSLASPFVSQSLSNTNEGCYKIKSSSASYPCDRIKSLDAYCASSSRDFLGSFYRISGPTVSRRIQIAKIEI